MRILQNVGMWMAAGALMLLLGGAARGQASGTSSGLGLPGAPQGSGRGSTQTSSPTSPIDSDTSISPQAEEQQAKMRNADSQKQLVADAQRLLSLANELKADVDKTTKDTLSLDVIRKADEIEKLAHNVKEKMKCSGCSGFPTVTP